jgi:hypothetical protein
MSILKKLSQIELFLDGTYTKEEGMEFIFNSRCISGYLERALANLEFSTSLSRINIKCTKNKNDVGCRELNNAPYLEVVIFHDLSNFFDETIDNKQNIYIEVINSGLREAAGYMPIPLEFCANTLSSFKNEGYINEWVHLEKEWVTKNIRCVFRCDLKVDAFYQFQEIYINGDLVLNKLITRTKPRETLFFRDFGKASIKNENEIHYKNRKRLISTYNIELDELSIPSENISEH